LRKADLGAAAYAYPKMIAAKMVFVRFFSRRERGHKFGERQLLSGPPWLCAWAYVGQMYGGSETGLSRLIDHVSFE